MNQKGVIFINDAFLILLRDCIILEIDWCFNNDKSNDMFRS